MHIKVVVSGQSSLAEGMCLVVWTRKNCELKCVIGKINNIFQAYWKFVVSRTSRCQSVKKVAYHRSVFSTRRSADVTRACYSWVQAESDLQKIKFSIPV